MSLSTSSRRARRALPVALLSLALVTAGCGGGDDEEVATTTASEGGASEVLGAENPASGDPVKVGFISSGQTQALDVTDEIKAAEATVAYANQHLGGLGGRPIELVVCQEKGTPAGGQACGNQFVQEDVAALIGAGPSFIDASAQVVSAEGIPVAIHRAATEFMLGTPGAFVFSNPVSPFGTPAAYAREQGIKSAALIVIDVPGVTGPANALGAAFFKNAGAEINIVAVPPGTADMTPQIQAAANEEPGMYYVLGDPNFCASAVRGIKTLGIDTPLLVADNCLSAEGAASIPGGYEGATVTVQSVLDPETDDYKLLEAVFAEFSDGLEIQNISATGFQAALGFVNAVNSGGNTDVSKEGIQAALEAMPEMPYPLSGGESYKCDGSALPGFAPNVCSIYGALADGTATDELENYRAAESEGIYTLG